MRMNRRNVLVGLGTIVAGGGAALGTGAFSTVEADRTVTVGVAEDSDALLGLEVGNSEFVTKTNGIIEINLQNVNLDATTTINHAFTLKNNTGQASGAQSITVSVSNIAYGNAVDGNNADSLDPADVDNIIEFNVNGTDLFGTSNSVTLASGDAPQVEIVIDTSGYDTSDLDSGFELVNEVTFQATGAN